VPTPLEPRPISASSLGPTSSGPARASSSWLRQFPGGCSKRASSSSAPFRPTNWPKSSDHTDRQGLCMSWFSCIFEGICLVKVAISDCNAAEIRTSALAAPLGFGVIRPLKLETAEHLQDACCLLRLTYATSAAATASFFVVLRRLALRAFSSRFRRRRGLPFRV